MSDLQHIQEEIRKLKEEYTERASQYIQNEVSEIFNKYGDILKQIGFRAYTIYFNDGDECPYILGNIIINDFACYDALDLQYEIGEDDENYKHLEIFKNIMTDFTHMINEIDFDTVKDIYGDHKEVIFLKDGTVQIGAYVDHD